MKRLVFVVLLLTGVAMASCDRETIEWVDEDGKIITLLDGSVWKSLDPATSSAWLESEDVLICSPDSDEGDGAEQTLKRSGTGQVDANAGSSYGSGYGSGSSSGYGSGYGFGSGYGSGSGYAGSSTDASADFEQLGPQGLDVQKLGQRQTQEVDENLGHAVQEQAESIGQEVVTTEAVGAEPNLRMVNIDEHETVHVVRQ